MAIPIWILLFLGVVVLVNASAVLLATLFVAAGSAVAGYCFGFLKGYERGRIAKPEPPNDPLAEAIRQANERLRQAEEQRMWEQEARRQARARKPTVPAHWKTLGLQPGATEDDIDTRYRTLALKAHPDRPGGSEKAMLKLNLARDLARRETRQRRTT